MRKGEMAALENALREHYRSEREAEPLAAERKRKAADLAALAASERPYRHDGIPGLAWAAIRSTPAAFWAPAAAVVALAVALALFGARVHEAETVLVASGPALAAASLAGVVRARSNRMQELEASCLHNSASVAFSRLMAFSTLSLLALAVACIASARIIPASSSAAFSLAPFLLSAAGGLMLARKVPSVDAAIAAVAWPAGVCALCILLRVSVPEAYCAAAVWIWAAAASAGALWLVREALRWIRLSAEGGCEAAMPAPSSIF